MQELRTDGEHVGLPWWRNVPSYRENYGKTSCYVSKEIVASKNLNAGTIVRELGKYIQGGGGGQAFFATAGGKNPSGIQEALEKAVMYLD